MLCACLYIVFRCCCVCVLHLFFLHPCNHLGSYWDKSISILQHHSMYYSITPSSLLCHIMYSTKYLIGHEEWVQLKKLPNYHQIRNKLSVTKLPVNHQSSSSHCQAINHQQPNTQSIGIVKHSSIILPLIAFVKFVSQ